MKYSFLNQNCGFQMGGKPSALFQTGLTSYLKVEIHYL